MVCLVRGLSPGVPALAFDVYPFFDILDERTGSLVSARDPAAVARALDRAAAGSLPGPEQVLSTTRARFGTEAVVPRLLETYERLAAR